ncbi:MAG TPA: flavin reductase family protein [Pirellulales bacterium]|jgi:flavin reductase (DIM6/NTAB) family NADH-FMN oxidoreductase RutF|nr:flavin reductase family protein [Pirellulales bacterium]
MAASQLEAILGRVPSGLFILTIAHQGSETGMLASWVMQAGFEPPMVTVAVKQGRYVAEWLGAKEPFVLNLLREDQKPLLSHFGRGFEPGEPAFTGLSLHRTVGNLPVLADILGHLECRPNSHVDSGDHRIFLADVLAGQLTGEGQPYVHIRKNGLRY